MFFTITNRDGQQTLSVFGETFEKVVPSSHPNYPSLVDYLTSTDPHDEEHVRGLVDPTVGIGRVLAEHFGDRMTFDLHNIYLDGRVLDGPAARTVKARMLAADQDWVRFARFLINLDANPSRRAQEATWQWVEANGLTITEDGRFLGYKAVLDNGLSSSRGPDNYVDGMLINAGETCQVPHEIGSVISKRRADVDDTPGGGCSVGLHVGTLEYATGFAPRLMTVAVNPRDVVSAPDGNLSFKIRVCEYEVISLADPAQFAGTSYDLHQGVEDTSCVECGGEGEEETPQHSWLCGDVECERTYYGYDTPEEATPADLHSEVWNEIGQDEEDDLEPLEGEDYIDPTQPVVPVEAGKTLADYAESIPTLKADLEDNHLGHKPLAARWSDYTTESSVRRWRKANGVRLTLATKIKG